MVIVLFTESYYPYNCGVTEAVQNLADNLRALGLIVYIVTPDYPNYSCGGNWVIRIPSYHIKERNYRAAWPIFSKNLIDKIISLKPNILHSHGPYATHRLASIIAKKLNIPLVMTWHTLVIDYLECWLEEVTFMIPIIKKKIKFSVPNPIIKIISWFAKKLWIKPMCNDADLILAPTNPVAKMLKSFNVYSMIKVLPLAINLEIPKPSLDQVKELKASLNISSNDQVLLYLGRVTPEKNIDQLLEVFRRILCIRNDCHLVIVGGGDEDNIYPELVSKLKIPPNKISFIGQIPREKTFLYYQMSDLFLFASTTDNTPRSILEAMTHMPVVAVRAGGVPDLVIDGRTGILVEPNNIANGMSKAALQILGNKTMSDSMKQFALAEVMSDKYKPGIYAKIVADIYQKLIKNKK
ncbi:MAG: Glycosyltransferase [uncultured bacterium]|nr:MAG: Glycosyltransferase [uncultured bacterium]